MQRHRFPVRPAFMILRKAQGQPFEYIDVLFVVLVFTSGMLYVSITLVKRKERFKGSLATRQCTPDSLWSSDTVILIPMLRWWMLKMKLILTDSRITWMNLILQMNSFKKSEVHFTNKFIILCLFLFRTLYFGFIIYLHRFVIWWINWTSVTYSKCLFWSPN